MSETEKRIKTSKKSFIIALILLLLTNIIMGVTLMTMSKESLREQIDQRMLDIANTAAYQLNGDELEKLQATDKGSESYNKALETLRVYQDNIQLKYIYGIRDDGDGTFSFTIDPSSDPREFGETVETTEALINASKGKADVDRNAYSDSWGRFYSAYSPVFDSQGNVAGIVGVDFDADWYDAKLNSNRTVTIVLTIAALIAGIAVSYYIMQQNRRRFSETLKSLSELDKETEKLDRLIMKSSIKKLDYMPETDNSAILKTLASGETGKKTEYTEYDEVNTSIESVYRKLRKYLKYIDSEVYTDDMTGLSNKPAYRKKVRSITEKIKAGEANFCVAFLNINEMKKVYTLQGYEVGDALVFECAKHLKNIFGKDNSFHIMGDDFIVVVEGMTEDEMEDAFEKFDYELKKFNENQEHGRKLHVAKGFVAFDPEKHDNYRSCFVDAKMNCETDKSDYYERKRVEEERMSILGF